MTRVYDPVNGLCYTDAPLFMERLIQVVDAVFIVLVGLSIMFANYRRTLKHSTAEDDFVSSLWNGFFNQYLMSALVAGFSSLIIAFVAEGNFYDGRDDMVFINIVAFTLTSYIYGNFLDSLSGFLGTSNQDVVDYRASNRWRQIITLTLGVVISVLMGTIVRFTPDGDYKEKVLMLCLLSGKLTLSLFLVGYYIWLYKIIHKSSFTMITAVLQGNAARGDAPQNPLTRGSIMDMGSEECMTYSSRYFQIHRLISLLKMLTTALYLEIFTTVVLYLVVFSYDKFGNLFLYFFMKVISTTFPFLYLVSCESL